MGGGVVGGHASSGLQGPWFRASSLKESGTEDEPEEDEEKKELVLDHLGELCVVRVLGRKVVRHLPGTPGTVAAIGRPPLLVEKTTCVAQAV